MPTIGVVDDRTDMRRQLVRAIRESDTLPDGWIAVGINPLPNVNAYPDWINEQGIAALVLDEKLQEKQQDVEVHVNYDGHAVVDHIRARLPDFPIFIVTAAPNDQNVLERFGDVEAIIKRATFVDQSDDHVSRMVRSGQRFSESNHEKLLSLEELSQKVALGVATEADHKDLTVLRAHFQLPYDEQIQSPEQWMADFEVEIQKFRELETEISGYLQAIEKPSE